MITYTTNHHTEQVSLRDVYSRVTDRIIAHLEQGVRPWAKPWSVDHAAERLSRPLRYNGVPYSGINTVLLWDTSLTQGFCSPTWMTYRQAAAFGAHVRKGEKGSEIIYSGSITRKETEEVSEDEVTREVRFMKGYIVFNVEQIEGLPEQYYTKPEPRTYDIQPIYHAENFFGNLQADIQHGGTSPHYSQEDDCIRMPQFWAFGNAESYYATLAHEATHWTKHPSRVGREFGSKKQGDQGYAKEELVAELGAAFLSADLELTLQPREDHAYYIASWLLMLKNDKRAIFRAAAHAQRAADYLHSLQG